MNAEDTMKKLKEVKKTYEDIKDELNLKKANGDLAKLCNLRTEFDETFDLFFDGHRNAFEEIDGEALSNTELERILSVEQQNELIEFYENYIEEIRDELRIED